MKRSCFIVIKALDRYIIITAPPKPIVPKTFFQFSMSDRRACCELEPFLYSQKEGVDNYLCNHLFVFASDFQRLGKC